MSVVDLDSRGRLTLPSELRRAMKDTKKVVVVNAGDHIKIIPVPDDPLAALAGALSIDRPFRELREEIEKEAQKEAKRDSINRD